MIEVYGNAFQLAKGYDILCVTSNGDTNRLGNAVMGRGIAKAIQEFYPEIPKIFGAALRKNGNKVQHILTSKHDVDVVSFPVKHHWFENADIELIKRSCKELITYAQNRKVLLPRPGCGNGHLDWNAVKPIIANILPDNIHIVHWTK